MHIAINAHLVAHSRSFRRAGVSHYIEQLLQQLARLDRSNRYSIYTTRGLTGEALGLPPHIAVHPSFFPTINPRVRIPWEQFFAPLLMHAIGADLFHGMLNVAPFASPVPTVITVHDLAFIRFPQTFRSYNRTYLDFATRISARKAAHIFAVSEHTKREVAGLIGVPEERITVTYDAPREHFRPPETATLEAFRRIKNLPEQFILYVGTLEPRKNIITLLEAYDRILKERKGRTIPLVIGGGKGWMYEPVFRRLEELGLQDRVRFAGYLDEEDLPLWYAAASVFVFPSIYEGFGMPPLEAMACGTPVVASNSSSLPEVVGEAGLMVSPHDAEGFANAIMRLLDDVDLAADLRERGIAQAQRFTWKQAAERTLAVYKQVGQRPH